MSFVDIIGCILDDCVLIFGWRIQITLAHYGSDFLGDVQKLAKVGIIIRARLVMPQC